MEVAGSSKNNGMYLQNYSVTSHHITSHHSLTDDVLPTNREYKHSTGEQQILFKDFSRKVIKTSAFHSLSVVTSHISCDNSFLQFSLGMEIMT